MKNFVKKSALSHFSHLRQYQLRLFVSFTFAFCLGIFLFFAQQTEWLPLIIRTEAIPSNSDFSGAVGPILLRSSVIPLLFILGIYQASFLFTSNIVCAVFWLIRGTEAAAYFSQSSGVFEKFAIALLLLATMIILLNVNVDAAAGVSLKIPTAHRPMKYFKRCMQYWGAMLTTQCLLFFLIKRL